MDSLAPTDLPQDLTLSYRPPVTGPAPEDRTVLPRWSIAVEETASGSGGSAAPLTAAPPPGNAMFRLRRQIARGGMGEVWEGVQESLGRVVAVKRIRRDRAVATSGDMPLEAIIGSFRQEALTAASLDHPNIVPIHDLGRDEQGHPLLAMKLVNGKPWNIVLREDAGAMDFAALLAKHIPILADVTQAVAFAHSRGIVHRDLKPSQVMLGEFGEVLLMDWGLALLHDSEAHSRATGGLTPPGLPTRETASNPAGTVAYMAPEQTERGAGRIGPWTDVYLLGAMLYEVLTGQPPHRGSTTAMAYLHAHEGRVVPMAEAAPGRAIPPDLEDLAMQAMQVQAELRVPSARAFLDRLQEYLSGESRRRESRALCDAAEAALRGTPGYRDLADAIVRLEQAQSLWPGNGRASTLRTSAIAAYARAALGGGDLTLARVQAERLPPGAETDALLREVALSEEAQRRTLATRRLAIVASFTLLLLLVTAGSGFTVSLNEARREAEQQRDIAQAERDRASAAEAAALDREREARNARAQSDGLVSFMITDLRARLEPMDPTLESLREVAVRAQDHFTSQSLMALTDEERERVHRGLVDVGLVLLNQSEIARARQSFERSAEVAREGAAHAQRPFWTAMEAESLTHVGYAASREGGLDEEAALLERAIALMNRAAALEPSRAEWGRELASINLRLAQNTDSRGDREGAKARLQRALAIVERVIATDPSEPEAPGILAGALNQLGVIADEAEETTAALEYYDRAAAAQKQQVTLQPEVNRHRMNLAAILASRSRVQVALGQRDAGVASALEAYGIMTDLLDREPSNSSFLLYYTFIGMFYLNAAGDTLGAPEAYGIRQGIVEVRRRLVEREPKNGNLVRVLARALRDHGGFIAERGAELDPPQALEAAIPYLAEATERLRKGEGLIPETVRLQDLLQTAERYADALISTGRTEDATRLLESLRPQALAFADRGAPAESVVRVYNWSRGLYDLAYRGGRYAESRDQARWTQQFLQGVRGRAQDPRVARSAALRLGEMQRMHTDAALCLGDWEDARDTSVARAEVLEAIADGDPAVLEDRDLALLWSADALLGDGDAAAALSTAESVLSAPASPRSTGIAHALRAETLVALGRPSEALSAAEAADPLLRREIAANPARMSEPGFLARALLARGQALAASGGDPSPSWRQGLALIEGYAATDRADPHRILMPMARLQSALGDPGLADTMKRLCKIGYVPARAFGSGCEGAVPDQP
jgi:tetratricopeptide (TPR) repeat protein